tara:strand:- start:440 stop:586 length:147 start_codon:yes stop_codon:yes gene_type:complete
MKTIFDNQDDKFCNVSKEKERKKKIKKGKKVSTSFNTMVSPEENVNAL